MSVGFTQKMGLSPRLVISAQSNIIFRVADSLRGVFHRFHNLLFRIIGSVPRDKVNITTGAGGIRPGAARRGRKNNNRDN